MTIIIYLLVAVVLFGLSLGFFTTCEDFEGDDAVFLFSICLFWLPVLVLAIVAGLVWCCVAPFYFMGKYVGDQMKGKEDETK